ncbi:hypothetical protein C8R47DRAFT_961550 [Mycena vitilis]|nr:hypothetical protein C8R47DRAFT_961550 [Mycena vitilis]
MIHKKVPSTVEVEEPPPYSLEHGASRSRRLSVLPPLPVDAQDSSRPEPRETLARAGPSFSQIRLDTHFTDITGASLAPYFRSSETHLHPGTYYVDPRNPISELTNKGKKKSRRKAVPDAVFRTRSAKINIELATTGLVRDVPKASVIVTSKSGPIQLNLLPADETRPRFDLEVQSNSGTVVVLIPKTYGGAIQLHTKSGSFQFLPAMSTQIHVVKSGDTESLVLFGQQSTPSSQLPSDFSHIRTRSGNIIVGLRGEDKYVEELGLWQRIGEYFKGDRGDHDSSST